MYSYRYLQIKFGVARFENHSDGSLIVYLKTPLPSGKCSVYYEGEGDLITPELVNSLVEPSYLMRALEFMKWWNAPTHLSQYVAPDRAAFEDIFKNAHLLIENYTERLKARGLRAANEDELAALAVLIEGEKDQEPVIRDFARDQLGKRDMARRNYMDEDKKLRFVLTKAHLSEGGAL